jgi:type IV pilus assembly protein PilB
VPTKTSAKPSSTVKATVDDVLEKALKRGASDVHLDPSSTSVAVRYRVDGWLQPGSKLPSRRYSAIVREVKRRVGIKTALVTTPQQGNGEFASEQGKAQLGVTTMPTVDGEKVVIHLELPLGEPATLETLGYWGDGLRKLEQTIAQPHGLVLAASPDKTAASLSLLGMVHLLNNPALDVVTLEDSPSQRLAGISQTEVKPSHGSFNDYLQASLKQDPNVVMLSSLHDPAAIATALQASLSGHLLLGGVHTTSSARAVGHLLHAYREPFLLAAAMRASVSLRFVRKLCPECRQTYQPDRAQQEQIKHVLKMSGVHSTKLIHELERRAALEGLGNHAHKEATPLSSSEHRIRYLWHAHPEGCKACRFTGYQGRQGICEAMTISDTLRKKIAASASNSELHHQAIEEGMVPLALDGFIKVLRGLTSLSEVMPLALAH